MIRVSQFQTAILSGASALAMLAATGCDTPSAANPSPANPTPTNPSPTPLVSSPPAEKAQTVVDVEPKQPGVASPADQSVDQSVDKNRIVSKTFDDIKFDIEPDAPFERSMLTDPIEQLVGQRIRIRGWILPTFRTKGLKEFVLVRDNQECCFGPGAALFDCILVTMQPGRTAEFSTKSVAVEGEFNVEEFRAGRQLLAIYRLDGEQVTR